MNENNEPMVFCDSNRVVQYLASNGGTWAKLNVVVLGWVF